MKDIKTPKARKSTTSARQAATKTLMAILMVAVFTGCTTTGPTTPKAAAVSMPTIVETLTTNQIVEALECGKTAKETVVLLKQSEVLRRGAGTPQARVHVMTPWWQTVAYGASCARDYKDSDITIAESLNDGLCSIRVELVKVFVGGGPWIELNDTLVYTSSKPAWQSTMGAMATPTYQSVAQDAADKTSDTAVAVGGGGQRFPKYPQVILLRDGQRIAADTKHRDGLDKPTDCVIPASELKQPGKYEVVFRGAKVTMTSAKEAEFRYEIRFDGLK
jgi:hypothetical protein